METHDHEDREAQAAREVGRTEVSRIVALALSALFLLAVLVVPSIEIVRDVKKSGSHWSALFASPSRAAQAGRAAGLLAANRELLASMNRFEEGLDEDSFVAARALSRFQWIMTKHLKAGNEQVVLGRRGWLYFRPAVDHVTGPGFLDLKILARREASGKSWEPDPRPDPVAALADFAAQLEDRGITLVVVPLPVKAAIHPEGLAPDLSLADDVPIENPSFAEFMGRLAELDIAAYSPSERLAEALRSKSGVQWPQFLRTDTHWTPQGMEAAAAGLAEFLAKNVPLPEVRATALRREEAWVEGRGDLVALLRLPAMRPLFFPERVPTQRVLKSSGEPWTADPGADVLVLGDSFTNIYSQRELGWGDTAGFAEQLSFLLQRPVDKLAVNAGGPAAARERLASSIASGQDRLAGKRVVIYAFSARELSSGDWRFVDLPSGPSSAPRARIPLSRPRPEPPPARGFLVWESNRGGDWRIWTRRLESPAARMLSPQENDRQHCCAHLSPSGSRLVYLSRAVPNDQYPELEVAGDLRLVNLETGKARTLVPDARPYGWGNRAAVWRNDSEVIYIDGQGRTRILDVDSGRASMLSPEPQGRLAWLFDATLRTAVRGSPGFSPYDAASGRIDERPRMRGCEPYFSHDGRFGFWVEGAGGPIRSIDLSSGAISTVLEHKDPRIPGSKRYAYFPMLSRDGRMFAFGASNGDHDHFKSNYDIFVAPIDPGSLQLAGRPMRMTSHPASDRYPDVHLESLDLARWRNQAPPPPPPLPEAGSATPPATATGPFTVRASLQACSRTPSLREISPYRDALIVCEWTLIETVSGVAPGNRIRAAHWALRDGASQPITSTAPGSTRELRFEPDRDRALFEGYPVFDTLKAAPGLAIHYAPGK
jgi:alginate O-acetyltransferase complex protein AlgJ